MGQLINGKWNESDEPQPPSPHKGALGTAEFPFDDTTPANRYHLYVSSSCPFALRAEIALHVTQLTNRIGLSYVHPVNTPEGWSFDAHGLAGVGDRAGNARLLHQVYTRGDPNFSGRVTVPLLFDTVSNRIVSHESSDIVDMFARVGSKHPDLTANPEAQAAASSFFADFFGTLMTVGRSVDQASYDTAIRAFYAVVENIDAHLAKTGKFLAGDAPTAVDILTFPAFLLFESGLWLRLLVTGNRLSDYPHLGAYVRRFYQVPGVRRAVNVEWIRLAQYAPINKDRYVKEKQEPFIPAARPLDWDAPV